MPNSGHTPASRRSTANCMWFSFRSGFRPVSSRHCPTRHGDVPVIPACERLACAGCPPSAAPGALSAPSLAMLGEVTVFWLRHGNRGCANNAAGSSSSSRIIRPRTCGCMWCASMPVATCKDSCVTRPLATHGPRWHRGCPIRIFRRGCAGHARFD